MTVGMKLSLQFLMVAIGAESLVLAFFLPTLRRSNATRAFTAAYILTVLLIANLVPLFAHSCDMDSGGFGSEPNAPGTW
jgi:hypothetical protein